MPCGLYGKLPAKRDFIALSVPGAFLRVFEPWLQAGLAASRLALREAWQPAYLRAPIWRFWLGTEVAGAGSLGAIMPSVDGIGRYFPLTLVGQAGSGGVPRPPELDPCDGWFEGAESLLLSVLTDETGFEAVAAALAACPDPPAPPEPLSGGGVVRLRGGALVAPAAAGLGEALGALRTPGAARLHAGMTYWWTPGGEGFAPRVASCRGMPDPAFVTGMLTGDFDDLAA
ncbi:MULTISPECIES: type VI secretion system-associated protein TagF [Methylobacterium]|uniref:Type VI secretion system-associated protein TagF n=3 Tax=Pseudomonadota TaxID=1224 RepID=A0ABQ4SZK0_9HYPH|nr:MULTISPECIES: type VI secretion system-associated protein TagF [Methylobacterium]PIU04189.1 MAG: type VI secretion system-associated protein TagF [Methylobacterium sp. CG09_land_8_20_14_0_10_71_15]PIU15076.1 MAG: type VI secretion system-associated protein TagF [Methylobacterium sp. CG08_land_8_20_14_0_20_71_15]GBU20100.1 type VI secretion-associated protein [Methylobacterium sp.]GJE07313.1 hypothetical protein AOPFMNJM_2639 [Methylobacterium jeotgali]